MKKILRVPHFTIPRKVFIKKNLVMIEQDTVATNVP